MLDAYGFHGGGECLSHQPQQARYLADLQQTPVGLGGRAQSRREAMAGTPHGKSCIGEFATD
jgi:hypothetical protein